MTEVNLVGSPDSPPSQQGPGPTLSDSISEIPLAGFFAVIPLGLGSSSFSIGLKSQELYTQRSLSEFVLSDINAVLPGIFSDDSDLPSFADFVLDQMLQILHKYEKNEQRKCCLTPAQLDGLHHGCCVHEDVADLWTNWLSRHSGASFCYNKTFFSNTMEFQSKGMQLTRDKDCAKTAVFPTLFLNVLLGDDLEMRDAMLKAIKDKIGPFKRFLCTRHSEMHYTTVLMTREENTSRQRGKPTGSNKSRRIPTTITAKLADSCCAHATLDTKLQNALKVAVSSLFGEDAVLTVVLSARVPLQNANNDCCFHTILYQDSTLGGRLLTTDNAACQLDAERLRSYTVFLAHKDLLLRGGDIPHMPELLLQWRGAKSLRSADMIRCRLAVVHTRYWEAYQDH